LISLLVFGGAAYLENTGSVNMARAVRGAVPLPKARPVSLVREPEADEAVRQLPLPKQKPRRANVRGGF
jgi:hypothetical protein